MTYMIRKIGVVIVGLFLVSFSLPANAGQEAEGQKPKIDIAQFGKPVGRLFGELSRKGFLIVNLFERQDGSLAGFIEIAPDRKALDASLSLPSGQSKTTAITPASSITQTEDTFNVVFGPARYEGNWNSYEKSWSGALYLTENLDLLVSLRPYEE